MQVDDPPSLPVGTEVSAKYKGAFCEAKVSKVVRNIKVKVAYKHGLGFGIFSDDALKASPGQLRVGAVVEARHPDRKELIEATVTKIQDCSQYTVVFDDGDITTLRRTALCLKSGRHFNESETLDQLPLTHPEHFGNPVVGGRRGRRRGQLNEDSSEDEDESDTKEVVNEKEEHIGKVVCIETESKKKDKEKWFPGLVVAPTAQATVRIRVKDEYLVRSFKDFRYYTVPKKEATEFTREAAAKQDGPAVQAALDYLDSDVLPPHWDRDALFGLSQNSSSEDEREMDSDSSDDEPREEKDHFVAQLYKYMDDRGTPLNKVPSIQNRDVDLYRLFRAVQKRGGYNRVTTQNQWKSIAMRLGFTPVTVSVTNLVKQAYKKFLQPYGEFHRKLGCSMLMTPRNSNRSKGRSLVRANSVASPKPVESSKESTPKSSGNSLLPSSTLTAVAVVTTSPVVSSTTAAQSAAEESGNTSESSLETNKNKRKTSLGGTSGIKVKTIVEKYEDKNIKDDGDVPLSKMKAAAAASSAALTSAATLATVTRIEEKEKEPVAKDTTCPPEELTRDSSPSGGPSSSSVKREKYQNKKPTPQSDEKRGKRKRDEASVEKFDAGDFLIEVGDKLKVYYDEKKVLVTYEAKVIEINVQRSVPMYLVHYTGWNNRYDEWVPRERIAENLSKGGKQKGRSASAGGTPLSAEKLKENPPKPPTATMSGGLSSSVSAGAVKAPNLAATKRGRGRSDSLPPRSTTPSSVASNSSRTKSPASSNVKKRPTRNISSSVRRISANVSDVSIPTESETDSDEPVRRPLRAVKESGSSVYKPGVSVSRKSVGKRKTHSVSAINSQSETDDEEDDGAPSSSNSRSVSVAANSASSKGRDYDLNQIRSELKGFQGLKSPSPSAEGTAVALDTKDGIKEEHGVDFKVATAVATAATVKDEAKTQLKEEATKSSTDISSETESYGDDDSQSSDKTMRLENMTRKFQQKRVPRIVEKILKDSQAEKRQEGLKVKPVAKEDNKNIDEIASSSSKAATEVAAAKKVGIDVKDEEKGSGSAQAGGETKPGLIAPARFTTTSCSNTTGGKQTSVIVEKPLAMAAKKIDSGGCKKFDVPKKSGGAASDATSSPSKKFIEPAYKEILLKVEPPAACSPSSSCSSSSSSSSSSTSASSRSLPDMSKLDISGSSSSSLCANANKDNKFAGTTAAAVTAKTAGPYASKAVSPDIYEFKDPEPFEFEVRKSPMVAAANTAGGSGGSSGVSVRKQLQKTPATSVPAASVDNASSANNPLSTIMGRKKRGSPMKELSADKAKSKKLEETSSHKSLSIVAEAKLTHHTTVAVPAAAASAATSPTTKAAAPPVAGSSFVPPPSGGGGGGFTPQRSSAEAAAAYTTAFDVLRKSPRVNLNMNALDEELAQTVQETTRALTDALQPGETTPTKVEPKAAPNSSTTVAPPTGKPTVGSPFIETGKDLSNVFELSFSEGLSGITESKDNRFELENAKILLSATAGAFDLEPAKLENKPTSIADKVLKAINQKNKNKELKDKDRDSKPEGAATASASMPGGNEMEGRSVLELPTPAGTPAKLTAPTVASKAKEPPPVELAKSVMSNSFGKHAANATTSSTSSTTTTTTTPTATTAASGTTTADTKVGILEAKTVKNNDLSETIQKLECAILRKTPVPSLAASSLTASAYYDDSTSSTDSERRLVIEDINEETAASPTIGGDGKFSAASHSRHGKQETAGSGGPMPIRSNAAATGLQAPIPLKMVGGTASRAGTTAGLLSHQDAAVHGAVLMLATKEATAGQQQQFALSILQSHEVSLTPVEPKEEAAGKLSAAKLQQQQRSGAVTTTTTTVVPISVPDIPVSVVVAPSMMAALQQQAKASSPTAKHIQALNVKSLVHASSATGSSTTASNDMLAAVVARTTTLPVVGTPLAIYSPPSGASLAPSSSSYYLHSRADLRPDDGVKPIVDIAVRLSPAAADKSSLSLLPANGDDDLMMSSSATVSLSAGGGEPPLNDSINLLCEETIPGSPAPAFGCKEEPQARKQQPPESTAADKALSSTGAAVASNAQQAGTAAATGAMPLPSRSSSNNNNNSSPNDSASQDDSCEELKKSLDIENEALPRKRRRRTRKQSEMAAGPATEHPAKRRRPLTCSKKNTAGTESDDNSDTISQRSLAGSSIRQLQTSQAPLHLQHAMQQQQQASTGVRPCPYNFLVQLNPALNSDQCIAILLKQIQDLRKTYNMIKGDLASIDRRRKKMRRREREKKQLQQQQQVKIG